MINSVIFSEFTELDNHHHNPVLEDFYHSWDSFSHLICVYLVRLYRSYLLKNPFYGTT